MGSTYVVCRHWETKYENSYGDLEAATSMVPFAVADDVAIAWKLVRNELALAPVKNIENFSICVRQFTETTKFRSFEFSAAQLLRYMADDTNPLEA